MSDENTRDDANGAPSTGPNADPEGISPRLASWLRSLELRIFQTGERLHKDRFMIVLGGSGFDPADAIIDGRGATDAEERRRQSQLPDDRA